MPAAFNPSPVDVGHLNISSCLKILYFPGSRRNLRGRDCVARWRRLNHRICFFILTGTVLFAAPLRAEENIAVLYPEVKSSFQTVFQTIIDGVASVPELRVKSYPVNEAFDREELRRWVQREHIDGGIALGKWGFQAARSLDPNLPVIVGALQFAPDTLSGISLAIDPDRAFALLKELMPATRRVWVVYSPKNNGWLIDLAGRAARNHGLELSALAVSDMREAVRRYREILKDIRPEEDAVWLPLDDVTVNDDVILPMLLEASWNRDIVTFSSNLSHVQKGILLAIYPDNHALGQRLGEMIAVYRRTATAPGVKPAADLLVAMNQRSAAHLGLRLTAAQQRKIVLTFPSR